MGDPPISSSVPEAVTNWLSLGERVVMNPLVFEEDPRNAFNTWEQRGKLKLTEAFRDRIMQFGHREPIPKRLDFNVRGLPRRAHDTAIKSRLSPDRLSMGLAHVSCFMRTALEDDTLLDVPRLIFYLGTNDVVFYRRLRAHPTMDASSLNEHHWPVRSQIVELMPNRH